MKTDKVLVFTCNWNAYKGMETAGLKHQTYSAAIHPLKVMCLGRLNPGIILKAFECGAAGVLLLGCQPEDCHYDFGNRHAEDMFAVASDLVRLMGFANQRLQMDRMAAEDSEAWVNKVESFMVGLD